MLYAIVAVIALIIDQAVKYWATANIVLNTGEKAFIPGLIRLTNIHNTGAAFSILEGARWFFVVLTLVFVALIVYVLVTDIITAPGSRWMAVIVMAGAVGNCIDRVICGYVVDMIEFEFINFPVFNVADIYITVGAVLFVLFTLLEKPDPKAAAAKPASKGDGSVMGKISSFLPKSKKTPIPDLPKREHKVETITVDPVDPFAEWERRAEEIKAANAGKSEVPVANYVKPEPPKAAPKAEAAPAPEETKAQPVRPAVSYPAVSEEVPVAPKAAPVVEAPKAAPAAPAAPVAPKVQAVKVENDFDFDLDSIMAEFRDI